MYLFRNNQIKRLQEQFIILHKFYSKTFTFPKTMGNMQSSLAKQLLLLPKVLEIFNLL